MWRRAILLAVTVFAAPAVAQEHHGGGIVDWLAGPGRVEGGQDEVTVHRMSSVGDALPLAIAHCSHFGRSAQFARKSGDDYVFRCVLKG